MSSNLSCAEPVVHREGLLWRAVRASVAMPGIFSPVLSGGDVLVDGGPMNDFPVDIMRSIDGVGPIIAVDVNPAREPATGYHFGPSISGWQVLRSKIDPFGKPMRAPSLFYTITRATEIMGIYQNRSKIERADLFISPHVERFSMLDFGVVDEVIEAGYLAAQPAIKDWLASPETQSRWGQLAIVES